MFGISLVHPLERHPNNFNSLLGNHLFSCRSVRLLPSLSAPFDIYDPQIKQSIPQTDVGMYVIFSSCLPSTLLTFEILSVEEKVSHCCRGTFLFFL